jgi:hypothetical protein
MCNTYIFHGSVLYIPLFLIDRGLGKRPFCRVDIFLVGLPESVHKSKLCGNGLVHNLNTVVNMLGVKEEVGGLCNLIFIEILPNAVLKLDYNVSGHQSYCQVDLDVHRVHDSDKNFT